MRLIDADALKTIKSIQSADFNSIETIRKWIDDAPTVDAVEVVRCKDCTGCRFVGTYDTQFPCANCARKTKDYYEPQTERSSE